MKYYLATILFVMLAKNLVACSCMSFGGIISNVTFSEYVAWAKVTNVHIAKSIPGYDSVEIEPIEVYKGDKHAKTLLVPFRGSSCGMQVNVGSTWVIYGYREGKDRLAFHYCSDSWQTDRVYDTVMYPNAAKNVKERLEFTLSFLDYIRKNKINPINKHELFSLFGESYDSVPMREKEFAIYNVKVGKDLSVTDVHSIKPFNNFQFNNNVMSRIKIGFKFFSLNNKTKSIPEETEITIALAYYPSESGQERSSVGIFR